MQPTQSPSDPDPHVLDELRAIREQLAALTAQIRTNKRKAHKRVKTLAKQALSTVHAPSDLDIARARRLLR